MASITNLINKKIKGKYLIQKELLQNEIFTLYLANNSVTEKQVIILIFDNNVAQASRFSDYRTSIIGASNFAEEILSNVIDCDNTDDGIFYTVYEYKSKHFLSEDIEKASYVPLFYAVSIISQLLFTMQKLHGKNIPLSIFSTDSIIVSKQGDVSPYINIIGFGIDALIGGSTLPSSSDKLLFSFRQKNLPPIENDTFFALTLFYKLITGKNIDKGQIIQPSDLNNDIPEDVENLIINSLNAKKLPSAAELLKQLNQIYETHNLKKYVSLDFIFDSTAFTGNRRKIEKDKFDHENVIKLLNKGNLAHTKIKKDKLYGIKRIIKKCFY